MDYCEIICNPAKGSQGLGVAFSRHNTVLGLILVSGGFLWRTVVDTGGNWAECSKTATKNYINIREWWQPIKTQDSKSDKEV